MSDKELPEDIESPRKLLQPQRADFNAQNGTLLLGLDNEVEGVNEEEEVRTYAAGNSFVPKGELHITVIGTDRGEELIGQLEKLPEDVRTQSLEQLQRLINRTDWGYEPTREYHHIVQVKPSSNPDTSAERSESIVQLVRVPAFGNFYQRLDQITGFSMVVPPAHITLYTKGTTPESRRGIGLDTQADLTMLSKGRIVPGS